MAVDLSDFKLEAVFSPETVALIRDDLDEYGEDSYLRIYRHGQSYAVQVCNESGEGGDIHNDSHTCPGSPGC